MRPSVAGTLNASIIATPDRDRPPQSVEVPFGRPARDREASTPWRSRRRRVPAADTSADRRIEPRHGAGAFASGKPRVHEHVDLRRREAQRARPHQQQHFAKPRALEVEHGLVPNPSPLERRATGSRPARCRRRARRSPSRESPAARARQHRHAATIVVTMLQTLNTAGASAGTKYRSSEFSMPIAAAAIATSTRNGIITRVSSDGQLDLSGHCGEVAGQQHHERIGEHDAQRRRRARS